MITPVPIIPFQLPEFPDKDYMMHEANERRMNEFYRTHPDGHMEILPSPLDVYDYHKIDRKHKIVFQIIRESDDASFLEGNYREYLAFYWCEKVPPAFPIFFWEREWQVGCEIPIEMMEEQFDIHFREQWKYADERRHSQFIERMELDKIRSRMFL